MKTKNNKVNCTPFLFSFVFCLLSFFLFLLSFLCLVSCVLCLLSFFFCLLSFVFCLLSFFHLLLTGDCPQGQIKQNNTEKHREPQREPAGRHPLTAPTVSSAPSCFFLLVSFVFLVSCVLCLLSFIFCLLSFVFLHLLLTGELPARPYKTE